jgi:hypothetical protein
MKEKVLYAHLVSQITARARDQLNVALYTMSEKIPKHIEGDYRFYLDDGQIEYD